VVGLVVAGAIVAGVLFNDRHHRSGNTSAGRSSTGGSLDQITTVQPFMIRGNPDDPEELKYTFDTNPATYWHTDQYKTAAFGNLYPGLGLAIELSGSTVLHHLTVTTTTAGWAAQTYTSATAVPTYQPVAAWGAPTDTKVNIDGSTTFTLDGQHGRWVLLWLTNLGQPSQTTSGFKYQARINELSVN
jgi:putative peptidoglycan lipid II flippase